MEDSMNDLSRTGGVSALVLASTFVVGFAVFGLLLSGSDYFSDDPADVVGFLADHQSLLSVWHFVIYIVFGIGLVVLTVAVHERLDQGEPVFSRLAGAFGLIWAGLVIASGMIAIVGMGTVVDLYERDPAQAGTTWAAIESVQFGIGGGVEVVGALWVLLVGWAALRSGVFPRGLSYLSIVIGVAGVLTVIPALELFGALFGLGLIGWFVWVGAVMARGSAHATSSYQTTLAKSF
jgi:hypothetical protein